MLSTSCTAVSAKVSYRGKSTQLYPLHIIIFTQGAIKGHFVTNTSRHSPVGRKHMMPLKQHTSTCQHSLFRHANKTILLEMHSAGRYSFTLHQWRVMNELHCIVLTLCSIVQDDYLVHFTWLKSYFCPSHSTITAEIQIQ